MREGTAGGCTTVRPGWRLLEGPRGHAIQCTAEARPLGPRCGLVRGSRNGVNSRCLGARKLRPRDEAPLDSGALARGRPAWSPPGCAGGAAGASGIVGARARAAAAFAARVLRACKQLPHVERGGEVGDGGDGRGGRRQLGPAQLEGVAPAAHAAPRCHHAVAVQLEAQAARPQRQQRRRGSGRGLVCLRSAGRAGDDVFVRLGWWWWC